ncbi:MAG: hypothetical protein KAS32_31600, partial [Candidatus Peribacteraceae bacterium]|nr:hypothetical protein [Candidatus Peribacteraceae bacterium]
MFTIDHIIEKSYQEWIVQNVAEGEDFGNCTLWCRVMQQAFPELERIEGDVYGKMFLERSTRPHYHEYLITPEGKIIDPTAGQFDLIFGKGKWYYDRE